MGYKFGEKEFVVPEEVTYRQYYKLNKLLGDAFDFGDMSEVNIALIVKALFEKDLLPDVFATLLIPTGVSVWKEEYLESNRNVFIDIGDKTAVEILESFLSGRGNLIESILNFFDNFLNQKEQSISESKQKKKVQK
jgi:hypothetical protein